MSEDGIRLYLNDIGKRGLLTAEQEQELSQQIEAGLYAQHLLDNPEKLAEKGYDERDLYVLAREGSEAKDHMLESNLRLAVSLAKRYSGRGLDFLDLIQEANMGLIRAVEKFDYQKGYKFSTYATWWVRQALTRGLADTGDVIRKPVHMQEQINKLKRVKREVANTTGDIPTEEQLADALGVDVEKIRDLEEYSRSIASLDMPIGEDDGSMTLGDLIADDQTIGFDDVVTESIVGKKFIETAMDVLNDREQRVIRGRFGFDTGQIRTLDDIGKEIGVTRERIRQIERVAIQKLQMASTLREFAPSLDEE